MPIATRCTITVTFLRSQPLYLGILPPSRNHRLPGREGVLKVPGPLLLKPRATTVLRAMKSIQRAKNLTLK